MKANGWFSGALILALVVGCTSTGIRDKVAELKSLIDQGRYEELALGLQDLYGQDAAAGDGVVSYGLDRVIMPPDGHAGDLENALVLLDALDVQGGAHQTTVLYGRALAALKAGNDGAAASLFEDVVARVDAKDEHKAVSHLCLAYLRGQGGQPDPNHWQAFLNLEGSIGSAIDAEQLASLRGQASGTATATEADVTLEALFDGGF